MIAHDADRVRLSQQSSRQFPRASAGWRRGARDRIRRRCDVAAGERSSDDEGSSFDAVGDNAMPGAVEFGDALDANRRSARALDVCAHGVEQRGEVSDFRLAGAILHDGLALGERGGHQHVFGAGDGNFVENNFGATKTVRLLRGSVVAST